MALRAGHGFEVDMREPGVAVITFIVAGDVSFAQVQDKLSKRFEKWPARAGKTAPRRNDVAYKRKRAAISRPPPNLKSI